MPTAKNGAEDVTAEVMAAFTALLRSAGSYSGLNSTAPVHGRAYASREAPNSASRTNADEYC